MSPERKWQPGLGFVICETDAAIAWHIREVGQTEPNFGGHKSPQPLTLCHATAAWDVNVNVAQHVCNCCPRCYAEYKRRIQ